MRARFPFLLLLAACGDTVPIHTGIGPTGCEASADPVLEIAQYGPYGELQDGSDLLYGHPPQGGAPYAPFSLRISGMEQGELGMQIEMEAVDADSGELLGTASYAQRFICSNTGENLGTFVGADLHMRFFGGELSDLEGRTANVTISATNDGGTRAEAGYLGVLTRE